MMYLSSHDVKEEISGLVRRCIKLKLNLLHEMNSVIIHH